MPFHSPLRYPGGKRKLANYLKQIFESNHLIDGDYVEPYAGGASAALTLLFDECSRNIWINDLDKSIYAFWYSVLNDTDNLCQLINDTPVSMEKWHKLKNVQNDPNASLLDLGFSTFFLNRTNRSGIISGGVIGGKEQKGKWKLDARYNKANLIKRIYKISSYSSRIRLYNQDAVTFITNITPDLPEKALLYLDPPYYVKGQELLYKNYYREEDHKAVANVIRNVPTHWIVSYDSAAEIHDLYKEFRSMEYYINYSAQDRYKGSEVMFFSHSLTLPVLTDTSAVKFKQ